MRPEFGCAVHEHVFDVLDASAFGSIENAVRKAIERWEPRATVVAVDFDLDRQAEGRLDIVLTYEIPEVPGVRNLVHPFYVIPEEDGGAQEIVAAEVVLVVRLPEIQLDNRGFQELVSEARTRIAQRCPEWTEHNVSDPGITLIELFAWMTEMTTYRLNRVPDKIYVRLLELLGVPLRPATPARTMIRFQLSAPPIEPVTIAADETEVGTVRTASEESVVFEVAETRTIEPLTPVRLRRRTATARCATSPSTSASRGPSGPTAPPSRPSRSPATRSTSASTPRCRGCSSASRSRPSPRAAPASTRAGRRCAGSWRPASGRPASSSGSPSRSWRTAPAASTSAAAPSCSSWRPTASACRSRGQRLHWLRCRVATPQESGGAAYERPPEISSITAAPIGATLLARHADHVDNEVIGESDGTPGQTFTVLRPPMLAPSRRRVARGPRPRARRSGSAGRPSSRSSTPRASDRCYVCDAATGTIELGPAVRQADGDWRHYGAVPPKGATLRLSRYRHGGGLRGNVAAGTLTVLKRGPAGIASVTNPTAARGGVDPRASTACASAARWRSARATAR